MMAMMAWVRWVRVVRLVGEGVGGERGGDEVVAMDILCGYRISSEM